MPQATASRNAAGGSPRVVDLPARAAPARGPSAADPEPGSGRTRPHPAEYATTTEAHARGAILVAAVFDAFLSIYNGRIADLMRLYTGGTGILPQGAVHPDLVNRLADEAAKAADHVLTMCVRALDYCPPVDLTFGEYLRAVVTADVDLVPSDEHDYRIAFVEAFRRRGLYPRNLRTLSVENLRWRGPADDELRHSAGLLKIIIGLRSTPPAALAAPRRSSARADTGGAARRCDALRESDEARRAPPGADPKLGSRCTPPLATRRAPGDLRLRRSSSSSRSARAWTPCGTPTRERSFEGGCTLVADLGRRRSPTARKPIGADARGAAARLPALLTGTGTRATYFGRPTRRAPANLCAAPPRRPLSPRCPRRRRPSTPACGCACTARGWATASWSPSTRGSRPCTR